MTDRLITKRFRIYVYKIFFPYFDAINYFPELRHVLLKHPVKVLSGYILTKYIKSILKSSRYLIYARPFTSFLKKKQKTTKLKSFLRDIFIYFQQINWATLIGVTILTLKTADIFKLATQFVLTTNLYKSRKKNTISFPNLKKFWQLLRR